MGNFLRRIRTKQQYRDAVPAHDEAARELHFSPEDIEELRNILWSLLAADALGKPRGVEELGAAVAELRRGCDEAGYAPPADDELARRLLVDTTELEQLGSDVYVVHKLETEGQVLALLFEPAPGPPAGAAAAADAAAAGVGGAARAEDRLKAAAVEVLLCWYAHSQHCADALSVDAAERGSGGGAAAGSDAASDYRTPASPPPDAAGSVAAGVSLGDPALPQGTLQSFVWNGSELPEMVSPTVSAGGADAEFHSPAAEGGYAAGADAARRDSRHFDASLHQRDPALKTSRDSLPAGMTPRSFCGSYAAALLPAAGSPPATGGDGGVSRRSMMLTSPPGGGTSPPAAAGAPRGDAPQPAGGPAARYARDALTDPNAALMAQLRYCIRAGLRSALRVYSTAHFSRRDDEQTSAVQRQSGPEWSSHTKTALARTVDLSRRDGLLLPPPRQFRMTVVLDLDETLIYARRGPLWVRPGVDAFLRDLVSFDCEVICWTASNRSYAGGILSRLDPRGEIVSQCIYAHPKWQRASVRHQVKALGMLGRDLDRTLIIDNLPDAVRDNPENAIVVEDYEGCERHQTTLSTAAHVVRDIARSAPTRPVPAALYDLSQRGALKRVERRLATGVPLWCYQLNSEPDAFTLPL